MASVNPDDRDRGLRLVGAVTGAVAALSLVAVGAATALAAGDTRHAEQLRATTAEFSLPTGGTANRTAPVARPAQPGAAKPRAATQKAAEKAKPKAVVKAKPATETVAQPSSVASTGS